MLPIRSLRYNFVVALVVPLDGSFVDISYLTNEQYYQEVEPFIEHPGSC